MSQNGQTHFKNLAASLTPNIMHHTVLWEINTTWTEQTQAVYMTYQGSIHQAVIYLLKANNRNTKKMWNLPKVNNKNITTTWRPSEIFIVNFEQISDIILAFLSLTLNK